MNNKYIHIFIVSIIILIISIILSILYGHQSYSLLTLKEVLFNLDLTNTDQQIIYQLRIPRTLLALIIGASLGVSGVLVQALTNNSMASPCIFGINAGASLGIVLCLLFLPAVSINVIILASLLGSTFTAICIAVSSYYCDNDPIKVTLIGVVITSLISSMTIIGIISNGGNPQEVLAWITGTLVDKNTIPVVAISTLGIAVILSLLMAPQINTLILGNDVATSLGQNLILWKIVFAILIIIFAGIAVSLSGAIGFIGLVVPHITKYIIGSNYRFIIPFSMIFGAIFLVLADILTRALSLNIDLPIGLTMAIIGAPFLLYLTQKKKLV